MIAVLTSGLAIRGPKITPHFAKVENRDMKTNTKHSTQVEVKGDDDRAKRRHARAQLHRWLSSFDNSNITIGTDADVEQHAKHIISLVRETHSQSSSAAHRRFKEVAAKIDDQIGLVDQSEVHMKKLVDRMIRAAELEVDVACPWDHLRRELEYKTRQLAVANALWAFNTDLAKEWTIPLEEFARTVWGDEERTTKTIRTTVSKLRQFFKSRGVLLNASVHSRPGLHRIDCKLL